MKWIAGKLGVHCLELTDCRGPPDAFDARVDHLLREIADPLGQLARDFGRRP